MIDSLTYQDYTANIHYSSEDDIFFGKILGIDDLITFEGSSINELKQALKVALEDYFVTCKQLNKSPDKAYKGVFNVRVPVKLHQSAAQLASIKNISLNELVKSAIIYAVDHPMEFEG